MTLHMMPIKIIYLFNNLSLGSSYKTLEYCTGSWGGCEEHSSEIIKHVAASRNYQACVTVKYPDPTKCQAGERGGKCTHKLRICLLLSTGLEAGYGYRISNTKMFLKWQLIDFPFARWC